MPAIYHEGSWLGNATDPEVLVKDTVGFTGKNRLKNTATTQTVNGVTFTVNADKSVTVNGTATADAVFVIHDRFTDDLNISAGTYIGSGITNGVSGKQYIRFFCTRNDSAYVYGDIFNGEITISVQSGDIVGCLINIASGQTVSNLTFYPMIRKADITDPTYEPYHESVEEEIEQIYADNGVLGAKNLLENKATSQTINGVTFTVNADGSVTANGTATTNIVTINIPISLPIGKYTFSGTNGQSGGSDSKYYARLRKVGGIQFTSSEVSPLPVESINGSEKTFSVLQDGLDIIYQICIYSAAGAISNLTFYPMLRLASDPDDTYQPYAMTNRELMEAVSVEPLNIVLSASDKATKLRDDSRRCGHVVNIRVQLQVTAEIANNTEIFRLNGLPHTGYGIAILGETNTGEIIPLMIPSSGSNFVASCRKTIPTGYYAISYTYVD